MRFLAGMMMIGDMGYPGWSEHNDIARCGYIVVDLMPAGYGMEAYYSIDAQDDRCLLHDCTGSWVTGFAPATADVYVQIHALLSRMLTVLAAGREWEKQARAEIAERFQASVKRPEFAELPLWGALA